MTKTGLGSGESKLETIISYLLTIGVITSLVLETIGIVLFARSYGHLNILLQDKTMFIHGQNFFSFIFGLFRRGDEPNKAILFMTLGIVTLILTPYVRVIASALYFIWKRDAKYVVITVFVLIVLSVSLALH